MGLCSRYGENAKNAGIPRGGENGAYEPIILDPNQLQKREIPQARWRGVLTIGTAEIPCYVLEDALLEFPKFLSFCADLGCPRGVIYERKPRAIATAMGWSPVGRAGAVPVVSVGRRSVSSQAWNSRLSVSGDDRLPVRWGCSRVLGLYFRAEGR